MRATDFFVRYDRRRERYRVTFAGWLLVAITGLMGLAAVVGLVRAVDSPLRAAPDTTLVGPIIAPTPLTAAAATSARPAVWAVWEEGVGDTVRYRAPDVVTALVVADFQTAGDWWRAHLRTPDALDAGLADYYAGPLLEELRREAAQLRATGTARLIYQQAPPSDGRPAVEVTTFSADGQTAYLTHLQGASRSAEYRVADGALTPGSQQAAPPLQATYRLAFDPTSRRWKVHALLYAGALR